MDYLTIDVFDQDRQPVGTSDAFLPPDNGKVTVQTQGIVVKDTFYVMVHWNNVAHECNRLGYDQTNDYSSSSMGSWFYDGTNWRTMASMGELNGWFMIHARGFETYLLDNPGSGMLKERENDSYGSILEGYNIYRSDDMYVLPFVKINDSPVVTTDYVDTVSESHFYGYYVEAVYNDGLTGLQLCTAAGDTVMIYVPVGLPDHGSSTRVWPNPVTDELYAESDKVISGIVLYDLFGRRVFKTSGICIRRISLPMSDLTPGIYLLQLEFKDGLYTKKVVKQ
jgi:hypothetical protein